MPTSASTQSHSRSVHTRRGGVMAVVLSGVAIVSASAVAAFSYSNLGNAGTTAGATKASVVKGERKLRPGEVAVVLHLLGIHPEGLAACGITGQGCDAIFDVGSGYCLQAERLEQLQLAHKNVNMASEKAVRPDAPGATDSDGRQIPLEQCQTALTDLENAGFTFVTSGLDQRTISKLATIKANQHWGLPEAYLTVNRSDEDWLALRGALCARRYANQHNEQLEPRVAQVLAAAEADPVVAQALVDSAGGLASVKESWRLHETAP